MVPLDDVANRHRPRIIQCDSQYRSLASDFDVSRPAISKHLRILREAALVTETRDGRERIYQLRPRPLREVASWLESYRVFWLDGLNNLKQMLEAEEKTR